MYAFLKENTILNIADLGLKIGDVVTVICVGGGGGGGGGGSTTYHNSSYPGGGTPGYNAGYHIYNEGYRSGMGYGAGGGGGNGAVGGASYFNGGGGGGGGAGTIKIKTVMLNSQMIPITVGDRGAGGGINATTLGNGRNGANGGASSFGSYITSLGGGGGGGGGGSSNNYQGGVGIGGFSANLKDIFSADVIGRGSNGGDETNPSNSETRTLGGWGGDGFLPFLSLGVANGGETKTRPNSYIRSPFTQNTVSTDFTNNNARSMFLGSDYGINNFGRGLVMLLWD